jgi:hypothetical protein
MPLSGESFLLKSAIKEEDARSDVRCMGFWRRWRQAYFDVRVISPYARSYLSKNHKQMYREAEQAKDRHYKARINNVEHADFTPLAFTTAGGFAPKSEIFLKRISQRISEIKDQHISKTTGVLRCRFSFALLRTTLMCLRGTRKRKKFVSEGEKFAIDRAVQEARIAY